jgi:hypothetical protein
MDHFISRFTDDRNSKGRLSFTIHYILVFFSLYVILLCKVSFLWVVTSLIFNFMLIKNLMTGGCIFTRVERVYFGTEWVRPTKTGRFLFTLGILALVIFSVCKLLFHFL